MFDILKKFQAGVFGNFEDIKPKADFITKMFNLFEDEEFFPNTIYEITSGKQMPRLQMISQETEWTITFLTSKIDIVYTPKKKISDDEYSINTYCESVKRYHKIIFRVIPVKGKRISLVTSGILREMKEEELTRAFGKIFIPIPFYKEKSPFEWKSRIVANDDVEINGKPEVINTITNINRFSGEYSYAGNITPLDRLEIELDINTSHHNTQERFEIDDINKFYDIAIEKRKDLLEQITTYLEI